VLGEEVRLGIESLDGEACLRTLGRDFKGSMCR